MLDRRPNSGNKNISAIVEFEKWIPLEKESRDWLFLFKQFFNELSLIMKLIPGELKRIDFEVGKQECEELDGDRINFIIKYLK